uniref:monovalent cation/H(+) antiporter subunit G n=1 Tax=Candidatus Electrothrix sp. TaxID=2170559 RepID=UPI004055B6D1
MMEWIAAFFLIAGSLFMLVASIGVVKFSDVYMRMHAITKAASLGTILMLAAVSIIYVQWIVWVEALMVVLFVIVTAPIASHMIAKAAHKGGNPKGPGYIVDELEENDADKFEKVQ